MFTLKIKYDSHKADVVEIFQGGVPIGWIKATETGIEITSRRFEGKDLQSATKFYSAITSISINLQPKLS